MNIKELYWKLIAYRYRPHSLWYSLKCRLWTKYTTVKPRYLPHTWTDRCDLMPHMMFEILSDFIEKECSPGPIDWYHEHSPKIGDKYVRDEMQELYDWWHSDYNRIYPLLDDYYLDKMAEHGPTNSFTEVDGWYMLDMKWDNPGEEEIYHEYSKKYRTLESDVEKELEENLLRLVRVIPFMWT